jgi:hypothetical protein
MTDQQNNQEEIETEENSQNIEKQQEEKLKEKIGGPIKKKPLIAMKGQRFDSADHVLQKEKIKQMREKKGVIDKKPLPQSVKDSMQQQKHDSSEDEKKDE